MRAAQLLTKGLILGVPDSVTIIIFTKVLVGMLLSQWTAVERKNNKVVNVRDHSNITKHGIKFALGSANICCEIFLYLEVT